MNTETINLKALLAENQAETAHVKDTLVEMELERDRLRVEIQAAKALNEKLAQDINRAGDTAMDHVKQIGDLITARRRDADEIKRLRARVAEAEQAVRTTMNASDEAVFGLTARADKTIRDLTKLLAKPCPSCPCAIHRSQIINGKAALDVIDKAKS